MEPKARQCYEDFYGEKVLEAGLVVCKEQPWLACSPDGLVIDPVTGDLILLEIKCPISCEDNRIVVTYVEDGKLDPKHEYYMQVQLSMYLTKAKVCDFFIFSMADFQRVTVHFDPDFL